MWRLDTVSVHVQKYTDHDDVIKWKHFPRNWPFVRGIHRSRWIPHTKASNAELWCFLWSEPLSKQPWGWWFETLSRSLWRHRNGWRKGRSANCTVKQTGSLAFLYGIYKAYLAFECNCIHFRPLWLLVLCGKSYFKSLSRFGYSKVLSIILVNFLNKINS